MIDKIYLRRLSLALWVSYKCIFPAWLQMLDRDACIRSFLQVSDLPT